MDKFKRFQDRVECESDGGTLAGETDWSSFSKWEMAKAMLIDRVSPVVGSIIFGNRQPGPTTGMRYTLGYKIVGGDLLVDADDQHRIGDALVDAHGGEAVTEMTEADLDDEEARAHSGPPMVGGWGVLSHELVDGEPVWDGCRPTAWRLTRSKAEDAAREMGAAWIAPIVAREGGWSTGDAHRVEAVSDDG